MEKENDNFIHPWGAFLNARLKVIFWMNKKGRDDAEIARSLSMDETQVYLIRTHLLNMK